MYSKTIIAYNHTFHSFKKMF